MNSVFRFTLLALAGVALAAAVVVTGASIAHAERRVMTDPYDVTNRLNGRRMLNGDMVWTDPYDATYRRRIRTYGAPSVVPGGMHDYSFEGLQIRNREGR